jgi:uncharacterized peroxidase-related enzyme
VAKDDLLTWLRVPSEDGLPPEIHELWQRSLEKLGFVPNVLRLYALRPDHLLAWNAWYDQAMKGDSGLTKAEREMIAVVVSVANDCAYCIAAHGAALRKLTKTPRSPTRSLQTTRPRRSSRRSARCSITPSS